MSRPPLFVVGLPRSGSTLVSRLLNESPELMSVNDLYYLQTVLAHRADRGPLDAERFRLLLDKLLGVVTDRSTDKDVFIGQLRLSAKRIISLRRELFEEHRASPMSWASLLDRTLSQVALACGKQGWADKTPQNFFHIERLTAAFPQARFVFVVRDPRRVLASLKHATGVGHDPRRYHPWVYALYWRAAARAVLARRSNPRVWLIRYEDLVGNPRETISGLNQFLEIAIPPTELTDMGSNTSFPAGRQKELGATECWICDRVCEKELSPLGYAPTQRRPVAGELFGLAGVSLRFAVFQIRRWIFDRDSRSRIATFSASVSD